MTRALIVDDDDVARELLRSTLQRAGFAIFELPSPIGATQTIVRERIQLLVLDIQMPDMSGDKLARLLRKNPRLQSLAIVLVSGSDQTDLDRLASEVDADAVVSKSAVRSALVPAVNRALSSRAAKKANG